MLVPALAFADSAKALVANASDDMARVRLLLWSALTITALIMLVWVALTPVFPAAASALNSDPETVRWTVTSSGMLFVPYVLFSFNAVMDSFFYGLGRTKYLAFQSAITNGTVYVVAFILCITGAWDPTFEGVMFLFVLGIVIDTVLTVTFLVKALYLDGPVRQPGAVAAREGPKGKNLN